jgi:hypothetical protein
LGVFLNYNIFIVKIVSIADYRYYTDKLWVIRVQAQFPILENDAKYATLQISFWGLLGSHLKNYYKIGDYIIVQGILSLRRQYYKSAIQMCPDLMVQKFYPFLLDEDEE